MPAAAAKKNVKAKQAAVKAETKNAVPKKVGVALLLCAPSLYMPLVSWLTRQCYVQAETSSSEEESSDEDDTPVKANGAATPATAKVTADHH